jgi:hypothetical protein
MSNTCLTCKHKEPVAVDAPAFMHKWRHCRAPVPESMGIWAENRRLIDTENPFTNCQTWEAKAN